MHLKSGDAYGVCTASSKKAISIPRHDYTNFNILQKKTKQQTQRAPKLQKQIPVLNTHNNLSLARTLLTLQVSTGRRTIANPSNDAPAIGTGVRLDYSRRPFG